MAGIDTRNTDRESLFMFADVELDRSNDTRRIRVRNLSEAGMMGEGGLRVERGARLRITFRGMESILGHVAWVEGERFGIAFEQDFDIENAKRMSSHFTTDSAPDGAIVPRKGASEASGGKRIV